MIAIPEHAIANGALILKRAARKATPIVTTVARAYGGTVSSCAWYELYPKDTMIVGYV